MNEVYGAWVESMTNLREPLLKRVPYQQTKVEIVVQAIDTNCC